MDQWESDLAVHDDRLESGRQECELSWVLMIEERTCEVWLSVFTDALL